MFYFVLIFIYNFKLIFKGFSSLILLVINSSILNFTDIIFCFILLHFFSYF